MKPTIPAEAFQTMTDIFDELLDSLATLHALSTIRLPLSSEEDLYRQAMEVLIENYSFDACSIFLNDKNALREVGRLTWQAWEKGEGFCLSPREDLFLQNMMSMAVKTGEAQVCSDCLHDRVHAPPAHEKRPVGLGSVISAPIIFDQKTLGIVNASSHLPEQISEWQKRLIPVFCRFLGQIVTSNRLFNNLDREVSSRTRQLDALLDETRRMEQHYQALAMIDDLTGIYNRRFFFLEAKRTLGRAVRHFHPFALLILDIDRFKYVNDTYGHTTGDIVLQDVTGAMRKILRETDILARTGGEEFAVALPETAFAGTRELAERLRGAVENLCWNLNGEKFRVTVSIGCAQISAENISKWLESHGNSFSSVKSTTSKTHLARLLDRLYSEADTAMYIAKRKGGNQIATLSDID